MHKYGCTERLPHLASLSSGRPCRWAGAGHSLGKQCCTHQQVAGPAVVRGKVYMVVYVCGGEGGGGVYGGGGKPPKLIHTQWKLSNINADTIGTTHVYPEYGGDSISGASGYNSSRHGNMHSHFSARHALFSGAVSCCALVRILEHC